MYLIIHAHLCQTACMNGDVTCDVISRKFLLNCDQNDIQFVNNSKKLNIVCSNVHYFSPISLSFNSLSISDTLVDKKNGFCGSAKSTTHLVVHFELLDGRLH